MRLRANPNRMELLRLKRRLVLAERGHKLLKDKLDELMRFFLETIKELITLKNEVEKKWIQILKIAALVRSRHHPDELMEIIKAGELLIMGAEKRLLNLAVPILELNEGAFALEETDLVEAEFEVARKSFFDLLPLLLKMANLWRQGELLADEIETTRRRVNALEHILIPSLKETIRYIESRLEEIERSYKTQLMRLKEIIERH
ncbi:MAG: V-type ATP synthase subunit D [Candidatus Aminicenantes bacterium]|nr:V-type ATP synthase subunit D [Candidatus Aminicenantes bacterium]